MIGLNPKTFLWIFGKILNEPNLPSILIALYNFLEISPDKNNNSISFFISEILFIKGSERIFS